MWLLTIAESSSVKHLRTGRTTFKLVHMCPKSEFKDDLNGRLNICFKLVKSLEYKAAQHIFCCQFHVVFFMEISSSKRPQGKMEAQLQHRTNTQKGGE